MFSFLQQSLYVTTNHDLDHSIIKRLGLERQCNDELLSQEIAFTQLSSTKMTKQIKSE